MQELVAELFTGPVNNDVKSSCLFHYSIVLTQLFTLNKVKVDPIDNFCHPVTQLSSRIIVSPH